MNTRYANSFLVFGALMLTAAAASATQPGNMMRMTVTTKIQMSGLPSSMPPQTHTTNVCTPKTKPDPRTLIKQQKMCKYSDFKQSGDSASYHVVCGPPMQMTADATASFSSQANGDMRGKVHIAGVTHGQPMQMDMTYDGVRTGSCDYTPPPMR